MKRRCAVRILAVPLLLLAACRRPPDLSPPALRLGEQECAWCRMLVSDERYAAALVYAEERDVSKLVFDDINCVFGYLSESPPRDPYRVYTHDHETKTWLDARTAVFVHSAKLETPMAAQVAAVADRAAAERLLERCSGRILTFGQVAELFTPKPPPTSQP